MLRRYALVRQVDESDCGAAALATVALHYRQPIALQQLRDLTGTDQAGTNLLGLLQAAERLGFSAKGVKGDYADLGRLPLPAIAHIRNEEGLGHFVVVHRVGRGVVVADPRSGVRQWSRDEFGGCWTGYLLVLVPNPTSPVGRPAKGGRAPTGPFRRFLGLLAPHSRALREAFVCAMLMTLLGIAPSYLLQHLVDSVLVRGETGLLNALGIGLAIIAIFRALFSLLREYLLAHVGRQVDLGLTAGYARHLLHLPMPFFEMRRVGEVLSRVNDAARVRDAVGGAVMTAVVDGTLVLLLLGILWTYDLPLALAVTIFVPLFMLGVIAHHPTAWRRSQAAMEDSGQLYAHLMENIAGVDTIKAFGAEQVRAEEGETRLVRVVQSNFALQKLRMSMNTLGMLMTALAGLAVLWYGSHRVMGGAITAGQLMFFFAVLGFVFDPLQRLAGVTLNVQEALVAVDRLYEVMDLDREQLVGANKAPFSGVHAAIELRGVCFGYGCREDVLTGIDMHIPAGQTTAIVGESGSGKSTLLKLLLGFYGPTKGQILIDGTDMRDLDLPSLRGRIGLVSQDPFVFNGTLRGNVTLGRPGAGLDEVIEAIRAAGLEEFVNTLPDRYDTVIGERGANLSGGQRQRLAIARALLRRPDVLIFDEATSHLDTATERAIQENLRTALAGRTVILVAHRLSTVKDADNIYVMNRGRVVERGNHRELLAQSGWYAALWRSQSGAESLAGQETAARLAVAGDPVYRNGRHHGSSEGGDRR